VTLGCESGADSCNHPSLSCLNHYELIRKYRCSNCGKVLMCDCEEGIATRLLPHQISKGVVLETQERIPTDGFAHAICGRCRCQPEAPYPKAESWGNKGKVQRFYWREIKFTYFHSVLDFLEARKDSVNNIIEFEQQYPSDACALKADALKFWQRNYLLKPKYDTHELTQAEFLEHSDLRTVSFPGTYRKVEKHGQDIGRWVLADGSLAGAEDYAKECYHSLGFSTIRFERRIPLVWTGALLGHVIQDPSDPLTRRVMRQSTIDWSKSHPNTACITLLLPTDFGTASYSSRRMVAIGSAVREMRMFQDLCSLLREGVVAHRDLLDYLWVNDEECCRNAEAAIQVLSPQFVTTAIQWLIADLWHHSPGWPDFLVYRGLEWFFSEVKSPKDRLSSAQIRWLEWARLHGISFELCHVVSSLQESDGSAVRGTY
jgi:hypothetical protein